MKLMYFYLVLAVPTYQLVSGQSPSIKYHPFFITGQLTHSLETTPLTPLTQNRMSADLTSSPSGKELSSQPPPYQLESVQVQPPSLEEEIKEFEGKYANLVHSVLVSFQQSSVSFSDIQACLMSLPVSLKLQLGNLLESKARQLSQASSISELFLILSASPYWNFHNPNLLSHLVEQFGDDQTKQQKDKYLEELRGFRMRTKVKDFIGKWTGASQSDNQELVLE